MKQVINDKGIRFVAAILCSLLYSLGFYVLLNIVFGIERTFGVVAGGNFWMYILWPTFFLYSVIFNPRL